jgi:DNA-binding NtrC family response regulator
MNRILIVDDEPNVVNFLSILLQREGYEVVTATSGKEALEKLKENRVDVVLADLKMPEMDGLELLSRIKQMDNQIAVIIMTAYASIETAIEAMRRGAFDYVIKPFKVDEITLVVKRALQERKLILENIELKKKVKQY